MTETLKPGDRVKTIHPESWAIQDIPVGSEGTVRNIGVPEWEPGDAVPVDFDNGPHRAIVWFENIRPAPDQELAVWNVGDTAILPAGAISLSGATVVEDTKVTITEAHVNGAPGRVRVSGARVRSFHGPLFTAYVFSVVDLRKPEPTTTVHVPVLQGRSMFIAPAHTEPMGITVPAGYVDEDTLRYNGHTFVKTDPEPERKPEVPTFPGSLVSVEGYSDHLLTEKGWVDIGTGYFPHQPPDYYGRITVKRVGWERDHGTTRVN